MPILAPVAPVSTPMYDGVDMVRPWIRYFDLLGAQIASLESSGVIPIPEDYGARGDAAYTTGSISSGSALLTVGTTLSSSDIGKVIGVAGAGAAGVALATTIVSVAGTVATLAATASTTVSGASVLYGTDDTVAVQQFLDENDGCYFPPNSSYLVGPLYVENRPGLTLWSHGFGGNWPGSVYQGGNLILKPGGNTNPLVWLQNCYYAQVCNLVLNGAKEFQPATGGTAVVLVRNGAYSLFSGCYIVNGKDDGMRLENWSNVPSGFSTMADEVNVHSCWILSHNGYGAVEVASGTSIQSPGDQSWINCHINFNGLSGYYKTFGSFSRLTDCEILTNGQHGVYISGSIGCKLTSCSVRNNNFHGLYLNTGGSHALSGNHFHYNSGAGTGYSNIAAVSVSRLIVTGNVCTDIGFTPRASYGIDAQSCTDLRLTGNNCYATDLLTGAALLTGSTYEAKNNIGISDTVSPSGVATWYNVSPNGINAVTINWDNGQYQYINLVLATGPFTFSAPTNATANKELTLAILPFNLTVSFDSAWALPAWVAINPAATEPIVLRFKVNTTGTVVLLGATL